MADFDFDYAELEDNDAIKREYTGYSGGLVRLKKGEFFYIVVFAVISQTRLSSSCSKKNVRKTLSAVK